MRDLDLDKSTHETQIVSYGNPSCVRSCGEIYHWIQTISSEFDTALKVRQSAQDIVVSHRDRSTLKYATFAEEVRSISSDPTVIHGSRR